jgi:tetratricopeptide (TPR) repeat protein
MTLHRLIPSLVCVAALAACATPGSTGQKAPALAAAMSEADAAVLAGQGEKAYAILRAASNAYPTDKSPWLRMAQLRFDSNNYGEAIVNALEALQRDPDDTLANSIVAVSGLRVSSKALADLTQKNNLSGTVRSEAQDLAKLLRSALNEQELVPKGGAGLIKREAPKKPTTTASAAPAAKPAGAASNDPFGALK